MLLREFPTGPASVIAGVPRRTLAEWDTTGFLRPSVQPTDNVTGARVYSFEDLIAIRVARALRDQGIPMQRLRRVIDNLRALGFEDTNPLARACLIVRGQDVQVAGLDQLISVLTRPGQITIGVVDLGEQVKEVKRRAAIYAEAVSL